RPWSHPVISNDGATGRKFPLPLLLPHARKKTIVQLNTGDLKVAAICRERPPMASNSMFDFDLGETADMLRDTVSSFASDK
ncbi:hypothetical protein ABTM36_20420, partial [Acinetobacter baumannii]